MLCDIPNHVKLFYSYHPDNLQSTRCWVCRTHLFHPMYQHPNYSCDAGTWTIDNAVNVIHCGPYLAWQRQWLRSRLNCIIVRYSVHFYRSGLDSLRTHFDDHSYVASEESSESWSDAHENLLSYSWCTTHDTTRHDTCCCTRHYCIEGKREASLLH